MENEEIDLRDYLHVIARRKWLVIIVLLVSVITTMIISFNLPTPYQATVTIRNGGIPLSHWIIENELFVETDVINEANIREFFKKTDLLQSIIKKLNLNTTVEKLQNAIQVDIEENDNYVHLRKDYLSEGEREHIWLYPKKCELVYLKVEYPGRNIPSQICESLTNSYISMGEKIIIERLEKIKKETNKNVSNNVQHFKIINPVYEFPNYPRSKIRLNIGISVVLGLFLGISLSIIVENLSKLGRNKIKKKDQYG